jgi:preprotein translocase subunit SecA
MEDNLMRIFGDPERTKRLLSRAGMKQGEAIESRLLSRQIERAQRKVEAHNFDIRKQLLEYDDVANDQRKVVYQQRSELMEAEDIADAIRGIRADVVNTVIDDYIPPQSVEELWDKIGLTQALEREFGVHVNITQLVEDDPQLTEEALRDKLCDLVEADYEAKVASIGEPIMRGVEKAVMLQQLDTHWKEHIAALDYLRQGIHLRGYAQRNPKQEYKREAFEMFSDLLDRVKHETIAILAKVQIRRPEDAAAVEARPTDTTSMRFQHAEAPSLTAPPPSAAPRGPGMGAPPRAEPVAPFVRGQPKVGRNEPCPCGSGKKYKQCHGQLQ